MKVGDLVGYNWEQWTFPPSNSIGIVLEIDDRYGYGVVWWYDIGRRQQIALELLSLLHESEVRKDDEV